MTKTTQFLCALLLLAMSAYQVNASSGAIGQIIQAVSQSGTWNIATVTAVTAITNALPAGANLLGKVGIDQTTDGTTNRVNATIAASQTIAVTNTGTFAVQTSGQVSVPAITKVGATTSSAQLIAANATRKSIQFKTDCANTDAVAVKYGAAAAVYANDDQFPPCSAWEAPPGISVQTAIQVISNSGTQNVRVIEYP